MRLDLSFRSTSGQPGFRPETASYSDSDEVQSTSESSLRWSKGFSAFVLLTLNTRLSYLEQPSVPYVLEGEAESPAHVLYRSFDELNHLAWPRLIFGKDATYQDCIRRSSHQGPVAKQYSIRLDSTHVPPDQIRVWLDDQEISDSCEAISRLLKAFFSLEDKGNRHLRLGILRSGDLAYTRDIESGLLHRLAELDYDLNPPPVSHAGPQTSPLTETGRQEWAIAFQQLIERGGQSGFDFVVGIGSQATQSLRQSYLPSFGCPPNAPKVIFLGVTYPVASHLIDSLHSRYERHEVCGVAYGADWLRSIASLIHNWIVPCCKLKYIFFREFSQDCYGAEQPRRTRLHAEGHLLIEEVSPESLPDAVRDPEMIYLSWYTVEAILESNTPILRNLAITLRERRIVATTRSNCAHGFAFAAVAADDHEIGRQGAELIHGRLTGSIPHLGRHDIIIPRIRYWINKRVATQMNIYLSEQVMSDATEVYE